MGNTTGESEIEIAAKAKQGKCRPGHWHNGRSVLAQGLRWNQRRRGNRDPSPGAA
jgi:hypothetical protein